MIDDAAPILRRIELGEALLFDSSALAQEKSFKEAVEIAGRYQADPQRFRFALDVRRARVHRILPLSLGDEPEAAPAEAPRSEAASDDVVLPTPAPASHTTALTQTRIDRWKSQLLDLSLRNRLLNFRTSKKSLSLSPHVRLEDAYAALAGGAPLTLREEPAHLDADDPRAISRDDLLAAEVRDQQDRGTLVTCLLYTSDAADDP